MSTNFVMENYLFLLEMVAKKNNFILEFAVPICV